MLGVGAKLGLAFAFLGYIHVSAVPLGDRREPAHYSLLRARQQVQTSTVQANAFNADQVAELMREQQIAEREIERAEQSLKDNIGALQNLGLHHPNNPDLRRAITDLQSQLDDLEKSHQQAKAQLQQNQRAVQAQGDSPFVVTDATVDAAADQTRHFQEVSAQALAGATQASARTTHLMAIVADQPVTRTSGKVAKKHRDRSPASVEPSASTVPTQPPPAHPAQPPRTHPAQLAPAHPANAAFADSVEETDWYNRLKSGLLQYTVPDVMHWKVASTVTVQIAGEKAKATSPLDHQTDQAAIKVSRHMKVLVTAPDNPDEFTILAQPDTQLEKYVPEDGPTTWHFSVTPKYTAKAQKLVVQAWVIYDPNTQRELPVYRTVVNVNIPGMGECLKRLVEGDPEYWLKYGLPGGAGFIFISSIVIALWKWLSKRKRPSIQPTGAPGPN